MCSSEDLTAVHSSGLCEDRKDGIEILLIHSPQQRFSSFTILANTIVSLIVTFISLWERILKTLHNIIKNEEKNHEMSLVISCCNSGGGGNGGTTSYATLVVKAMTESRTSQQSDLSMHKC